MYYFLPQPPYFLLIAGLLIGITCGAAFEGTLKQRINTWSKERTSNLSEILDGFNLLLPFLGICAGICIFLASGLEIFSINTWIAYGLALPMTIFIAALVWLQLGQLLKQVQEGGSKALDLDNIY